MCSMISEQVKELKNLSDAYITGGYKNVGNKLRDAADTIEALSTKLAAANVERPDRYYGGGWISCDDKLPDKDGFYLATIDGEIAGEDKPFSGLAEFENGKWIDDEEDYQCIMAWQPLPEPYRP